MPQYYYVVDTSITNDAGVAVGQTTYDLLVDERLSHGVIPVTTGPGAGTTWAGTDSSRHDRPSRSPKSSKSQLQTARSRLDQSGS